MNRRRTFLSLASVGLAVGIAVPAIAFWQASASSSVSAGAAALGTGATPAGSASGRDVAVSWSADAISGASYVVKRYPAAGGAAVAVGGTCTGTVSSTSCNDTAVTPGTWKYTVTSTLSNWTGPEGTAGPAAGVTVGSPTFSGTSPTTVTSLPATITGTVSNFVDSQSLTFHLDSAGGSTLSGTPSSIPAAGGSASVSVTLPTGTSNGNHTIYAVTANGESAASASINVNVASATPNVPGTPDLASTSDSGSSTTDNITNDNTPTFTGTIVGQAGQSVHLFDGTTDLGSVAAGAGATTYSIDASTLSDGQHTITAKATVNGTTFSAASGSLVVTIDTTNPAAPTATYVDGNNGAGDKITGVAEKSATVTATELSPGSGTFTTTANASTGAYSVTVDNIKGNPTSQSYSYSVTTTDAAGNTSAAAPVTGTDSV